MNKQRRKELDKIQDTLLEVQTDLEAVKNEEEEAYDNLPESLQDSERGEVMQDAISILEDALNSIEEAIDYLNDILE